MTQQVSIALRAPGRRVRLPSPNPLFAGCPALFIQLPASGQAFHNVAPLLADEQMGAVMTVSAWDKGAALGRAAKEFLEAHPTLEHVLVDADRYSGSNRVIGAGPLSREWASRQLDAGTSMALTDSPYIPEGDEAAICSILRQAAAFRLPVVAALPCHPSWLSRPDRLDRLVELVNRYGVPVALMLEHRSDPFGVQATVQGLVDFLERSRVKVLLLRCDLSALGAVAWGASVGAFGTKTSLRHFYPLEEKKADSDKRFHGARVGAYVPCSMSYRTLTKIGAAVAADVEHLERWACGCRSCGGAGLDMIADEVTSYRHSMASIADLAEGILVGPDASTRQLAWVEKCRHAQIVNEEIRADLGIPWQNPAYLAGWHRIRQARPGTY